MADAQVGNPLIGWIGDDFTGAAAVMEVLAFAGLSAVLFTEIPSPDLMARFAGMQGIGLATTARSQSPDSMANALSPAYAWLEGLRPEILHYKLCSTFDSSPQLGSIGRAIEIGLAHRPAHAVPIVTAAPQMRRYQAFGNLFAGTPDGVFRLDRHPVMSRHPATPMTEADLLRHLAGQTDLPSALIDLPTLALDPDTVLAAYVENGVRLLSIDMVDDRSEAVVGRLLWQHRAEVSFVAGSQGVEYALVRHWQTEGIIAPAPPVPSAGPVDRIAAVSGSVSPITAGQIAWAGAHGFAPIPFEAAAACASPDALADAEMRAITLALAAAAEGKSPLIHTALGPDDPAVAGFRAALSLTTLTPERVHARLGAALGRILAATLDQARLGRAVISGGDTSGHALRELDLQALTALAPTIPGAALCTGHGAGSRDGLQIALKGGQMGSEDYFGWVRSGGGARP